MSSGSGKLLLVSPSGYSLGGVAEWLDYLVAGLTLKGWDVTVGLVTGRFQDSRAYLEAHPFPSVLTIANPTGSREGRIRALERAVLDVSPEIVLAVNLPDTYAAVERARRKGQLHAKVVMALHGIQPELFDDMRDFGSVLDGVVATNRLACELAAVDGQIERERIFYAPYGVADLAKVREPQSRSTLRIIYSGRIDRFQKRVFDIPRVLRRLEDRGLDYVCRFVGSGPDLDALRSECARFVPEHRVRFLGAVPPAELATTAYQNADVLLLTSEWETGPLVVWEAMMNQVAVVTSTYVGSGLEGRLRNFENCLTFPVGDSRAAADAIVRLSDFGVRRELVAKAYDLVLRDCTHDRSIEGWHNALSEILASPARRAVPAPPRAEPAGRLDRLLGVGRAEQLRRIFGLGFQHQSAGGEWPHSYGARTKEDPAFWALARKLDEGRPE